MFCPDDGAPTMDEALFRDEDDGLAPGTILQGRYRVDATLMQGGMGVVYLGTQTAVNRPVVIKTVLRDFVTNRRHVQRFYQEAQAVCRLSHPNIVSVFDFGIDQAQGVPFLVMERLGGESLADRVARAGPLTEAAATGLLLQVARGLVEAHGHGVVQRDLKPGNIFVTRLLDGREHVKVIDFGLAKLVDEDSGDANLTETGAILGTPYYMSPEQLQHQQVDGRADLYSLGCVLHFLLTGQPVFDGPDKVAIAIAHLTRPRPPLPPTLVDGKPPSLALQDLHRRLLSRLPAERPAESLDVAETLGVLHEQALSVSGSLGRPRGAAARVLPPTGPAPRRFPPQAPAGPAATAVRPAPPSAAAPHTSAPAPPPSHVPFFVRHPWVVWVAVTFFLVGGVAFVVSVGMTGPHKPDQSAASQAGTPAAPDASSSSDTPAPASAADAGGSAAPDGAPADPGPSARDRAVFGVLDTLLTDEHVALRRCLRKAHRKPADVAVKLTVAAGDVVRVAVARPAPAPAGLQRCLEEALRGKSALGARDGTFLRPLAAKR